MIIYKQRQVEQNIPVLQFMSDPVIVLYKLLFYTLFTGAAPEPSVTSLDETKNSALLQCEVRGVFPKPKLRWQDSDGNILQAEEPKVTERGGRYDVILQITVTKTDNYRCVATQKEISHQIYAETHVYISGEFLLNHILIFK